MLQRKSHYKYSTLHTQVINYFYCSSLYTMSKNVQRKSFIHEWTLYMLQFIRKSFSGIGEETCGRTDRSLRYALCTSYKTYKKWTKTTVTLQLWVFRNVRYGGLRANSFLRKYTQTQKSRTCHTPTVRVSALRPCLMGKYWGGKT
jgi:hypothetical protein